MRNGWQKTRHWDWAKEWASLFFGILPEHVCEAAMATCRITLQGPETVGVEAKNWGRWIRMRMQTFGHAPSGLARAVQMNRHWIGTDSHEAVDLILGCFGLTVDDLYDYYGNPGEGDKLEVNLHDVVTTLDADFTATAEASELEFVA